MTDTAKLILPKNSTTYERSHVDMQIESWALVTEMIQQIRIQGDPSLCDAERLPELSVDTGATLWQDDWSETRKRFYVENLWIFKLLEGTPLGVEAYLNLADGALIREILPPSGCFAMPDLGEVTHAQLLELMPQLRLYYHWPDKLFLQSANFGERSCADHMFAYPDQAEALGRYPVLYDPETTVETPLDVIGYGESGDSIILSKQGYEGTAFYADVAFADIEAVGTPLIQDPIVYRTEDPDLGTTRVSPAVRPLTLVGGLSYASRTFAMPDLGDVGTYDYLSIWDPTRVPPGHLSTATAAFYGDWSWLGLPAYNQILTVAVPGTPVQVPYAALTADAVFTLSDDQTSLTRVVQAVATAKRTGDRILLDLAPTFAGTRPATLPAITDISQ